MKPIRFHPEAESEMMAAAAFYETQQKDLGKRFLAFAQDAPQQNPSQPSFVQRNRI